jgi:murein L,D-transpeptidase YafK
MMRGPIRGAMLRGLLFSLAGLGLILASLCALSLTRVPVRAATINATDRIIVDKSARRMKLLKDGRVIRTYRIALGRGGRGPKQRSGDNKVPEGTYRIVGRNGDSAYHLSLRIDYPTERQIRQAREEGYDPGGDIMIHGIRNGLGWIGALHQRVDWTQGCIAVTNAEIEEIWRLVPDRTIIEIGA